MLVFALTAFFLAQEPPEAPSLQDFLQSQEKSFLDKEKETDADDDLWRKFEEKTPNIQGNRVVLRALDKITGRTHDFEAPINVPQRFRKLRIIARHCEKTPPEKRPETYVFLQVYEPKLQKKQDNKPGLHTVRQTGMREGRTDMNTPGENGATGAPNTPAALSDIKAISVSPLQPISEKAHPALVDKQAWTLVFSGWMFASNPGLNALEHPVYDIWPMACKASTPDKTDGAR